MGGSISRLEIEFDQEQGQHELLPLLAGSLLSGKVVIDVKAPIRSSKSPVLQLVLYGKEKVRMNLSKAKRTNGRGPAPVRAERPILHIPLEWSSFPMDANATEVPIGTYFFPFQIKLPICLPSSTYHPMQEDRSRSKMRFRIQYKLQASLFLPSDSRTTLPLGRPSANTPKPHHAVTRYVWIAAATSPDAILERTPCMVAPRELRRSGFFQKGTFLYAARVENTRLCKDDGDPILLHLSCRNDSSIVVHRVQISILEQVTWGTAAVNTIDPRTGTCKPSASLQQTEWLPITVLENVQLPGLVKEHKGFLKSVVESMLGSAQRNMQQQIYDDLKSGQNLIPIPLPASSAPLRESYQGQLIQISHILKIVFQTGPFCPTPVLEIPIHISARRCAESTSMGGPTGVGAAVYIPPPASLLTTTKKSTTTQIPTAALASSSAGGSTGTSSSGGGDGGGSFSQDMNPHPEIPMADAVILPDHSATAAVDDVIVLGGDAVLPLLSWQRQPPRKAATTSLSNLTPLATPTTPAVSVPALLGLMRSSLNDYDLIQEKLCDPAWVDLFHRITADQYGSIVANVHAFDQPRVAVLLAPFVNPQEGGLTCAYAAAAVRQASPDHRAITAQKLIPLCIDVAENHAVLVNELNGWEQMVTESILLEAMQQ